MKLFEDLPSTNRPITAENLNQIQDNLVVVSATEPTGDNREKVWIQKGKNKFNKKDTPTLNMYVDTSSNTFVDGYLATRSTYIKIEPNKTYTISKQEGKTFRVATCTDVPTRGVSILSTVANHTGTEITIITETNAKYLFINYHNVDNGDTANEEDIKNSIQIEQGSAKTSYEQYIEPKIYVLNDNDVYEEFISKEYTLGRYSTEEQIIGTWIDGKPIYRKVFTFETSDNADITHAHNIANTDKIWINEGASFVYINQGSSRETLTLNWYHDANTYTRAWVNPFYIRFKAPFALGVRTAYVVLEYTKTTD